MSYIYGQFLTLAIPNFVLQEILERTGYSLDVTTGQRKYGGPPPDWEGEPPSTGSEVRL